MTKRIFLRLLTFWFGP